MTNSTAAPSFSSAAQPLGEETIAIGRERGRLRADGLARPCVHGHGGAMLAPAPTPPIALRPLRIAVIAHLRHPIAAPFMGGMEAHCDLLVRTLRAAGHRPTLFAGGDSAADLPLHAVAAHSYQRELPWERWRDTPELAAWLARAYARAWDAIRSGDFDVVHNNTLFPGLHAWAARDRVPMVSTLHVPPFPALAAAVGAHPAPWHRLTVPSRDQYRLWHDSAGDRLAVAPNGIDLDRWRYDPAGGPRAIWSGRITPTKGTAEALRAATAAGIGLDVAGPIDCADYFAGLAPLLTGAHRYLGHLTGDALAAAVGGAAVALCTPLWDEPFGLVAAEALACGTPVAALARGALPEVVENCGALADTPAGLPHAIRAARAFPRAACRRRAEAGFGAARMIAGYQPSYAAAIASRSSVASTRAELA